MNRVYSSFDTILLGYLRGLLASEGVEAEIRNEFSASAFGELPAGDAMPELWAEKSKLELAKQIVDQGLKPDDTNPLSDWKCPECNETVEGQFAQCWHCGYMNKEGIDACR